MTRRIAMLLAMCASCQRGESLTPPDDAAVSDGDVPGDGAGDGAAPDAPPGWIPDAAIPADAAVAPFCAPMAGTAIALVPVADGLDNPVAVTAPPGDARLFVVEQPGRIRVVSAGAVLAEPFLSIAVEDLDTEQGLLGLAFHPGYAQNGRFFVFYSRRGNALRVAEYGADPSSNVADPGETVLLDVPHPTDGNHNGGTLGFGTDGLLYMSLGDGGGANDWHGNGQDPSSRLAKILRLDVDDGSAAPETHAWGLRNPWRFAVDPGSGDVWIGDVGQGAYEEIDVVRAGAPAPNFGWPVFEGPECFTGDDGGAAGCDTPELFAAPVTAYDRRGTGQCAVIAGAVYRGGCMPELQGRFFFGDYCSGEVRSLPASVTSIDFAATIDHTADLDPTGLLYGRLSAFGVDGYGELYVTALQSGEVYRIALDSSLP